MLDLQKKKKKKTFQEGDVKVKDNDHPANQKKISLVFYDLQNYDSHVSGSWRT